MFNKLSAAYVNWPVEPGDQPVRGQGDDNRPDEEDRSSSGSSEFGFNDEDNDGNGRSKDEMEVDDDYLKCRARDILANN